MTREEAIETIKDLCLTTEQLSRAETAIESLSVSEPQGLDEAAEEYEEEYGKYLYGLSTAFKAGAKWRDEQIPKLPDSVDEAAFDCATKGTIAQSIDSYNAFKVGAKWMAEQGEFLNGVVRKVTYGDRENGDYDEWLSVHIDEILEQLPKNTKLKPGDKVIVQIRKKEK